MNKKYYKLIAALLNVASDKFGNHGCNDFDVSKIIPDVNERRSLALLMHTDNGDPEEYDPEADYSIMPDYWLMSYFAEQLESLANESDD